MKESKTYIHPFTTGRIQGIKVLSVQIDVTKNIDINPCLKCVIEPMQICFCKDGKKRLETCPACFSNDPENKSKKPIYFSKQHE